MLDDATSGGKTVSIVRIVAADLATGVMARGIYATPTSRERSHQSLGVPLKV